MREPSPEAKDVAELLAQACTSDHYIQKGGHGRVYSLAHIPGLERFVLRVGKLDGLEASEVIARLKSSTILTPPQPTIGGINLGQALLHSPHDFGSIARKPLLSLHLRQEGNSLQRQFELYAAQFAAAGDTHPHAHAMLKIYGQILKTAEGGKNPFLSLLETSWHLRQEGYIPQLNAMNILIDPETGRLSLVDQLTREGIPSATDLDSALHWLGRGGLKGAFGDFRARPDAALDEQYGVASERIAELIEEAQTTFQQRLDKGQLARKPYAIYQPSKTLAVALTDPPQKLIDSLCTLYTQTGFTRAG